MKDNIFDLKTASPMLLTESDPFDSANHIYELKLDGIRCLAYLDLNSTDLRNKRNKHLNLTYPELINIHKNITERCIIDGELIILTDGKPNFFEIQKRSLMTNDFKIALSTKQKPVKFVAYDIIFYKDKQITDLPLLKRKAILHENINESEALAVSRFINEKGIDFFNLVAQENLEGVVAKKNDSLYHMGKRTKDWVKFKHLHDSDFIVCGYTLDDNNKIKSIVLGGYNENSLVSYGHVSLGISKEEMRIILNQSIINYSPFKNTIETEKVFWLQPNLVCTVSYMTITESGHLRQPVFKGLRFDKVAKECIYR